MPSSPRPDGAYASCRSKACRWRDIPSDIDGHIDTSAFMELGRSGSFHNNPRRIDFPVGKYSANRHISIAQVRMRLLPCSNSRVRKEQVAEMKTSRILEEIEKQSQNASGLWAA